MGRQRHLSDKLFEILVRQSHRSLLVYALALTDGDRDRAEEAVQGALVIAYERIADFDPERDFAAWVRGIVRNLVRRRRRGEVALDEYQASVESGLEFELDLLDQFPAGRNAVFAALRHCIGRLGDLPRRTVELFYFQRLDMAEVAERCGCAPRAAQKRLERARGSLHGCFEICWRGASIRRWSHEYLGRRRASAKPCCRSLDGCAAARLGGTWRGCR